MKKIVLGCIILFTLVLIQSCGMYEDACEGVVINNVNK